MAASRSKIVLIFLMLVFAAILLLTHKPEPTYQGGPLDAWIDNYAATPMNNREYWKNRGYFDALRNAGTNALPYLVRNLARNDSAWHKKYCEWQPRLPKFLKKFATPPKPLLQAMDGELAITYLGTGSIPYVTALLKHKSPTVRQAAASSFVALRMQTPAAKQAIPALIETLDDPNPDVRSAAVWAFTQMGSDASNAVPALTKILVHAGTNTLFEFGIRSSAAVALGKIGPPARNALPELKSALQENSSLAANLRGNAAVAIWRIDQDTETTLPVLLHEMPGVHELDKDDWIVVLGEMGPPAMEAVPQLENELKRDKYPWVRGHVTNALIKIDPAKFPAQKTNN